VTESPVLTELQDTTLVVRLNRPAKLNAFDDAMLVELGRAFRESASDQSVEAIVLTGAGRGFCSGADIKASWEPDSAVFGLRRRLNPVILAMADVEKPVIAAINGVIAGAGLGFAGVADVRLAADTAVFVPATAERGIAPDGGMTYSIPRLIGPGRAFRWLCEGDHIAASTALSWGLVDEVTAPDDLLPRALSMASAFLAKPGAAVALTKRLLRASDTNSLAAQLELEHRSQDDARRRRDTPSA
jgi:2-(1,2-epoxy-1,2-dihydrophenyl)acetyl-CoA isomerase